MLPYRVKPQMVLSEAKTTWKELIAAKGPMAIVPASSLGHPGRSDVRRTREIQRLANDAGCRVPGLRSFNDEFLVCLKGEQQKVLDVAHRLTALGKTAEPWYLHRRAAEPLTMTCTETGAGSVSLTGTGFILPDGRKFQMAKLYIFPGVVFARDHYAGRPHFGAHLCALKRCPWYEDLGWHDTAEHGDRVEHATI